jgi:Mg-chelatase subunit ChlD
MDRLHLAHTPARRMMIGVWILIAVVAGAGWWAPGGWARRGAIVLLRAAGLVSLVLAVRGVSVPERDQRPRHLVYLLDRSDSIDDEQAEWMARRVASLEAIRPPQMSRSLIAFGADAAVVPASRGPIDAEELLRAMQSAAVTRASTDLEAALLSALSAMPPQDRSRVILLSDGRQTAGNVERMLPHVRRLGLEVYPVVLASSMPAGAVWEQLVVPPTITRGDSVPVSVSFSSGSRAAQPVEVAVSIDGVVLTRRRTMLRQGTRVLELSVPSLDSGTMRLEVTATFANQPPQQRVAYVDVQGPPRVLAVLDRPTELPPVAAALKRHGVEVAVAMPGELPTSPTGLLDYDAVLLLSVPKSAIAQPQADALRRYVEELGGGLAMVGLGGELREEITREAPLDALLPVRFEAKGVQEAERRVCIVMLIDRSASMYGPRIAATKRAAVELIKQLSPEDLVGVFAFDTTPYVIVEVQPAHQAGAQIVDKLVRLKATGGTNIFPSLKAAQVRLQASGAMVKHIILLSDGNTPIDLNAYRQLMAEFTQQRISISTIGVGSVAINTDFLEWLSVKTGGQLYLLRSLEELPQLVARDTEQTLGQLPFSEGMFQPERAPSAGWFEQIGRWPPLKGFLTTTAKPGASVELQIRQPATRDGAVPETAHPLVAQWPLGLGRVAVFASDADARWSPDWVRWPQYEAAWAELLRRVMRPQPEQEVFVWVNDQLGAPELVVEAALSNPTAELVTADGTPAGALPLVQQGGLRWSAPVSDLADGWYRLVLRSGASAAPAVGADAPATGETGATDARPSDASRPLFVNRWIHLGHPQETQEERPYLPPDTALLSRIAQQTRGVLDAPDRAFLPPTEWVERRRSLRGWLVLLAMALLLADVAVRGRTLL